MLSSIRTRLIAICIAIVALSMLVMTTANFLKVKQDTHDSLDVQMGQLAESHASMIAEWVRSKKSVAASIKQSLSQSDPMPYVKAAIEAGSFDSAYIGFPDKPGVFMHAMPPGYNAALRPWYIQANQAGVAVLTLPYIDASTKKLVVTFADPIGPKGNVTAVVGADVQLSNVVRTVASIKPTVSSFAFLVDTNGTIITHPNQALALKPISEIDSALTPALLSDLQQQSGAVRIDGNDDLLYVRAIDGTTWLLVLVIDRTEATASLASMLKISAAATIAMILVAGMLLTLSITRTLRRLGLIRDALNDIASGDGDLTRRLDAEGKDELAQIAIAFNQFTEKIASVLRDIRRSSESVKVSSNEIATGNLDLSNRTEQQAGSIEETASAMEQLTSTVKQNADNARAASQLAESASTIAVAGGAVVGQVVHTMSAINDSSKKIVDIISVIDGIAFQTNILALNAAVEAARAGEQGRGFAVVASEVRSLAQRSAAAAKEIKVLIGDSVEKVDVGSKLVQQAGATMEDIVNSVKRVTDIVSEISAAGQEQSAGIEEVNRAISQMDEATQQNAALVEQAAAAAGSLQDQAVNLAQVVAGFRLDEQTAAAPMLASTAKVSVKPAGLVKPLNKPVGKPITKPVVKPAAQPDTTALPEASTSMATLAAGAVATLPAKTLPATRLPKAGSSKQLPSPDDNGHWEEF